MKNPQNLISQKVYVNSYLKKLVRLKSNVDSLIGNA